MQAKTSSRQRANQALTNLAQKLQPIADCAENFADKEEDSKNQLITR
jgi:hypothetical protein